MEIESIVTYYLIEHYPIDTSLLIMETVLLNFLGPAPRCLVLVQALGVGGPSYCTVVLGKIPYGNGIHTISLIPQYGTGLI